MNREILFRGKRNDNGEWVEGFYVLCRGHHCILQSCDTDHGFDERYCDWIEIDLETLCQHTGLPDKNGKKIFEGDIINYTKSTIDGQPIFGKACVDSIFNHELMRNMDYSNSLEVIGNIFDNAELIRGK